MHVLRVLIVAGDPLARAGLAAFLQDRPDLVVVGQVDASELAESPDLFQPDVVLWDLGWEASAGLRAETKALLAQAAELSGHGPPVAVLLSDPTAAVEAWTAGARGLLPRDVSAEQLVSALAALSLGLAVIDPLFSSVVSPTPHPAPELAEPVETLTPREREVLHLIAEGLPNKTIAQRLGISEHTVKFHANALMTKLGAQSRTDAVVRATRLGLIIL